ncbi:hypothetical protein KFL_002560050 [Klebsormidium nitens]|uniref:SMP domain-containing protein n=1 Tax=Klebsormidium nitens TaxID=105231 RepID=A0A0U9HKF9_KLENI|nr:hypothetical protein KFL_002560050 [Klebsormidium nitens]|eukprot:GAQ85819.1 hypothetical protein KFL_002560050 [Klebsormidium nitens]
MSNSYKMAAAISVAISPALGITHTTPTKRISRQTGAPKPRAATSVVKPIAKSKGHSSSNYWMSDKQAKTPMTQEAASRIQSAEAKAGDGGVKAGSFAARAQSAAARNERGRDKGGSQSENPSFGYKGDQSGGEEDYWSE